jgi:multisubunit Na+/H+ antiporter MnhG subunit
MEEKPDESLFSRHEAHTKKVVRGVVILVVAIFLYSMYLQLTD